MRASIKMDLSKLVIKVSVLVGAGALCSLHPQSITIPKQRVASVFFISN
jgi:hypothetical protein